MAAMWECKFQNVTVRNGINFAEIYVYQIMEYEEETLSEAIVLARTRAVDLQGVTKLNFWGSEISDISVVRRMPNLEVCSVSVNNIETLEDFSCCPNLTELYIRKNKIKDLSELVHLKSLTKLRNLWLADNPCAGGDNYRLTVLRALPGLQKLDNVVVTDEERSEALEKGDVLLADLNTKEAEPVTKTTGAESVSKETGATQNGEEKSDVKPKTKNKLTESMLDPVTLSWEETNKIREELGLKPLPFEKMTSPKPVPKSAQKSRNAHILQAVLILIRELDNDSLEILESAIQKKLHPES
ncbi:hypothetical protein FSP39_012527 [Pinctada imbricata]|uniref:Uncharacterized protein n=1 Tax=Pinctada imbricata TaxID=66713 RepID=A0AA89C956_PINIB|nr:hypothetical protein FSP39_012527 [Pinctada imbricata]